MTLYGFKRWPAELELRTLVLKSLQCVLWESLVFLPNRRDEDVAGQRRFEPALLHRYLRICVAAFAAADVRPRIDEGEWHVTAEASPQIIVDAQSEPGERMGAELDRRARASYPPR